MRMNHYRLMGGLMGGKGGGGGGGGPTVVPTEVETTQRQLIDPAMAAYSKNMAATGANAMGGAMGNASAMNNMAPGLYNQAGGMNNAAAGLQGAAAQYGHDASQYNTSTFQNQFFNPYTQDVAQNAAEMATRNFNQMTAPSLQGQLGQSGQFNSGRGDMAMQQAQRDQQFNTMNQQASLLNTGYNQSQQNYINSMGVGVQGANVMSGAASGLTNAANSAYNAGTSASAMPGQTFGQFAGGMAQLPMNKTTEGEQSSEYSQY